MKKTLIILTLALSFACSTPAPEGMTEDMVSQSTVDIRYQLGHSQYRYLANSSEDNSQISSYRDESLLETRVIPLKKYLEFLTFIDAQFPELEQVTHIEGCRTPFTIMLITKKEHKTVTGCRSQDELGILGQILKEGEHLFYSDIH